MKKFAENVLEWKSYACLMFTGSAIIYGAVALFLGQDSIPLTALASLLILSILGTMLQFLIFSDRFIKKMRYTLRVLIFTPLMFIVLAANAWFFGWFPQDGGRWLTFAAIFVAVLAVMTIGFEIYYSVTGRKYDGLLGQYRKRREAER